MKKWISCALIFSMALALLAGCGEKPAEKAASSQPQAEASSAPGEEVSDALSTIDEFLSSLASGAEITLAPGTYDLSQASTREKGSDNPAYRWDEESNALIIQDLDGVTIHGSGAEILLLGAESYSINLENCSNLIFEDLSFRQGNSDTSSYTSVKFTGCRDVTLKNATFEDHSDLLLTLKDCQNVTADSCHFGGSACSAFTVSDCKEILFDNCSIQGMTDSAMGLGAVFGVGSSQGVTISGCTFSDNHTALLLNVDNTRKMLLENNTFQGNTASEAAFCLWSSAPVLKNNTFEENEKWRWYYPYSEYAVDENGVDLTGDLLSPPEPLKEPGQQKEVHVSTTEEFLNAIAPDTRIILDCTLLDLSTAPNYGKEGGDYYFWEDTFEGPQLIISEVDNLTITAEGDDLTAHTIAAVPRYANVLSFRFCTNLTLSGFTAGHTEEPGFCTGGVLDFRGCRRTRIESCGLYGCGILGISGGDSEDMTVTGCDIYDCSYGGISLTSVNGLTIENTTFRDLGGPDVEVRHCKNATLDGKPIEES